MNLLWRELIQLRRAPLCVLASPRSFGAFYWALTSKSLKLRTRKERDHIYLGFVLSRIDAERMRFSQTTTQQRWYQRGALESQRRMHNLMNSAWTLLAVNPSPPLLNTEHFIRVLQFSHKGCDITLKLCFESPCLILGTKGFNGNYNLFRKDVWLT